MEPQTFEKDGHTVTTTVPSERTALLAAGFRPADTAPARKTRATKDVERTADATPTDH